MTQTTDQPALRFTPAYFARFEGDSDSLVWGHATREEAIRALLDCGPVGDWVDPNQQVVETGEFLEEALPRLLRERLSGDGVADAAADPHASWLAEQVAAMLDPIRDTNDHLPWTTFDVQDMTLAEAYALEAARAD